MRRGLTFPLFWRIFVFIWLAMSVTVVVSHLLTRELIDREREAIERQEGLREVAMEASEIRREEGRGDAWRYLREQGKHLDLHLLLVPGEDGDDRLPDSIRERLQSWYQQQPAVIELDNGMRLVAWPSTGGKGWLDPRLFRALELGTSFILLTLACWWIARLVSRPLRHMERTARTIAAGDTHLRVDVRIAGRRDEIGALASAFNAMTERLCTLLARQDQLMRDISHDLRTPLARQRVAIELASESGADSHLMASILRQNERLDAMTGQILTLYRVSADGDTSERESVELVRAVNEVLQDAADYAEQRGVDCHFSAQPQCREVTVLGDHALLRRALDNMVQNAIDYTPPGKAIQVRLRREDDWLACEITDQGPGVAPEAIAHLFEPFYRADRSRSGQGWGLGLAIARDILHSHDGRIEARNGDSGGLVVTIRLPVFTTP